jgi:hypothetical protein
MKKLILKRRTIPITPYNHEVNVVFTNDIRRAATRLAKEIGMDVNPLIKENMHALTIYSDGCSTTWNFFETKPDIGTITHELYHTVAFVLHDVGIKYQRDVTDEVWAYQLGDLTRRVVKFYHEVHSKKKFNTSNRVKA